MEKKAKIVTLIVVIVAAVLVIGLVAAGPRTLAQCKDGTDNDGDTFTDFPNDPGCSSKGDNSELNPNIQCDNGIDDGDADNLVDFPDDPGCSSPTDASEITGPCDDAIDNDGDGFTDYSSDPECAGFSDVEHQCSDTDGGQIYTVQGITSGSFGGTPFSGTDLCVDSTTLTEYYCDPFNLGSQNVNCAGNATTQCSNGACI